MSNAVYSRGPRGERHEIGRSRGRLPRRVQLNQVSITGMRDSYDPTSSDPRKAQLIQNAYPESAATGGGIVGRPGFRLFGTQLGSVGFRLGQGVAQYTKADTTETSIVFVGGLMYRMNWAARTITNIPLGGGVVVNQTAKLYFVTFTDKLIVSDGVNRPWMWDGTTFTILTNCPVLYGQPVIYYAKLFGIKATNRLAIVWSEENSPTTGYGLVAGVDGEWTLGQADQDPLHALVATNEALYYFRDRSIGAIAGAVADDFTTTGSREGVSETIGTTSPDAIVSRNNEIIFLDADSRPHVIFGGGAPRPIWDDLKETVRQVPRNFLQNAVGIDYTPADLLILYVAQVGSELPNLGLVYHPQTFEAIGVFRGFTLAAGAMLKDESLRPVFVHLSEDGYVYDHGRPEDAFWDDFLGSAGGAVAIDHLVEGTPQGWDPDREIDFTDVSFTSRAQSAMTIGVTVETPRGVSPVQYVTVTGGAAVYGVAIYGTSLYSASTPEKRRAVGIQRLGRWIKPRFRHAVVGERFGFVSYRASGYEMPAEHESP